jgi:hypothetical protein
MGFIQELERRARKEAREVVHEECMSSFNLYPSGKFYMPWATGNLLPCPNCNGKGTYTTHSARWIKKRRKYKNQVFEKYARRFGKPMWEWPEWARTRWKKVRELDTGVVDCYNCGGHGSHEAYRDMIFMEEFEETLTERGFYMEGDDGDGTLLHFYDSTKRRFDNIDDCECFGNHLDCCDENGYCDLCHFDEDGKEKP